MCKDPEAGLRWAQSGTGEKCGLRWGVGDETSDISWGQVIQPSNATASLDSLSPMGDG